MNFFSLFVILQLFVSTPPHSIFQERPSEKANIPEKALKPTASVQLPDVKGASENWLQEAQMSIQQEEYDITWQKERNAYQSPNRSNNLRGIYKSDEMELVPRSASTSEWSINFKLLHVAVDQEPVYFPISSASAKVSENKIEFDHQLFVVQYENLKEGIRQNVMVYEPKKENSKSLEVKWKINKELQVNKVNDRELEILKKTAGKTEKLITYNGLKAWDADGKELFAYFEINDQEIRWLVNVSEAKFPITIDPLSSTANWTQESNQNYAFMGFSVASAGDVNGDGYSDVVVGAPEFDGLLGEGKAFVYHGSSSGLHDAAWEVQSNVNYSKYGASVASAGDVNSDGYSDLIVGAPTITSLNPSPFTSPAEATEKPNKARP